MAEWGGFTFQSRGRGNPKRRGRGRGRGPGWGGSRGRFQYRSQQNPNKVGQPPQRPRTFDGLSPEGRELSPQERFHTLLELEVGIGSKPCTKEEVLSPGSSSSSKRSCTEMENNDENKSKVLIKKKCKKNLAGISPFSRDDGISIGKSTGKEIRSEVKVSVSEGENWDEEIRCAQLNRRQNTLYEAPDMDKEQIDSDRTTTENSNGLMLVQESYPCSGSNGTQHSKNPDWDVGLPSDDEFKQVTPRKVFRDKVVDCLSSAVTENCTCTSDEDTFQSREGQQDHALYNSRGVGSCSSPTAGSKMGPRLPSKSKSDSWTYSVFKQGSAKKKGKLKKKQRAASIPEYQGSTDDDTEQNTNTAFHKGERSKNCRQKKGNNSASKSLKDVETKVGYARAESKENDEIEVGVVRPNTQAKCMSKYAEDDYDSCQADDSLTDDENWINVVKKLSADGVDAEDVQERRPFPPEFPPEKEQSDQNMMNVPLSFRQDFRARFSYPPTTYMPYNHAYPPMRPSFPYGPPMWPMMQDPYFYGPAMMRGFHPDAISRYPIIHRFPRCMQPEVESIPPTQPVQSPGNEFQDSFYTVNESASGNTGYMQSMNAAYDVNAYGDRDYRGQENAVCEDNEYSNKVFVSDLDSSGNQSYISQDLNSDTWNQGANASWEQKSPLLQTPLPDIQEDTENLETQSDFISTEDEVGSYLPSPCEPAPRAKLSNFSEGMEMDSVEQPNYNWYNHALETPATSVGNARRKSKIWGSSLKQMTQDSPMQRQEETRNYVSAPGNQPRVGPLPPSSYAAVVSAKSTDQPGDQKRVNLISSAHLEERRRKSYPDVTAPQSGWGSGRPLVEFVSPQNNNGITKEKPQKSPFWQGTPSPVTTDTSNKLRNWSAGSQGWGTYNLTPVPRPVSAPPTRPASASPRQKTFAEILQRPRRLSLEDEVRGEALPKISSWRPSKEVEDSLEIQYPTSDIDYLDTHAHIDLLFQRHMFKGTFAKFCLVNKFPTNFAGCVAIFCYPVNFSIHYSLADNLLKENNIWGSFGCHPHQVKHYDGIMEQKIKDWMDHPKTVALGEIGLDYSDR